MSRKPRVRRTPEEKWEIVQEGLRSGNIAETCRRYGIAPNLFYRWKDEAQQGATAGLGGKSAAAAVVVGAAVILFDPIFQGLAISLMAGEVASTLLSRMAVPLLYYSSEKKEEVA